MRVILILLLIVMISGCATRGGGLGRSQISNFQIVEIHGKSYALDMRDGVLYEIIPTDTGFDISRSVGRVGL